MLLIIFGLLGGWIALLTVCVVQFIQLRQARCQRDYEWSRAEGYLDDCITLQKKTNRSRKPSARGHVLLSMPELRRGDARLRLA